MDYRQKLEALRACGVSMKDVASKAGLSHVAIYKHLNGHIMEFTPETKEKLDKAFTALQQELNTIQKVLRGEE